MCSKHCESWLTRCGDSARAGCDALEILDLEGNHIADHSNMALLACCPSLAVLSMADNPVAWASDFREQVRCATGKPPQQDMACHCAARSLRQASAGMFHAACKLMPMKINQ